MVNMNIAKAGKKTQFKKGVSGNPKGQPRKGASLILHTLKEIGITTMSKTQVEDVYLQLMQLTDEELDKVFNDKGQPIFVKVIADNLKNKDKNFDVLEKMIDRGIGKSIQTVKTEVKIEDKAISAEKQKKLNVLFKNNGIT